MADQRQALRRAWPGSPRAKRNWVSVLPAIPILAVLAVVGYAIGSILSSPAPAAAVSGPPARVGGPAPVFQATRLDGATYDLGAQRGHVVVVTFWATWCTACRTELPALQRLWQERRTRGFEVVAVNYRETDVRQMSGFISELGVTFPAVADPGGRIATAYEVVEGLPVTVVVDRAGNVSRIHIGEVDVALLAKELAV